MEVEVPAVEEGNDERSRVAQRGDLAHVLDKNRGSMVRREELDELCDGVGGELGEMDDNSMDNEDAEVGAPINNDGREMKGNRWSFAGTSINKRKGRSEPSRLQAVVFVELTHQLIHHVQDTPPSKMMSMKQTLASFNSQ
jgi:hypothetical protein